MEFDCEAKAGYKHHLSTAYLIHLKQEVTKVWTLVDLPDNRQAIEINGSLRRRRTWAVMLSSMKLDLWERIFSQVQGVDYDEFFSSVAMLRSVGIMLALTTFMKSGRWMSKQVSLPVFREERLYVIQSKFCRS